jgi:hypothetical protein
LDEVLQGLVFEKVSCGVVTQSGPCAVLDSLRNDIDNEEHEVSKVHVGVVNVQTLQHVLFLVNEHRLHGRVEVGERS